MPDEKLSETGGLEVPPDDMTIERWRAEAKVIGEGWVPERFRIANLEPNDDGPFGWTRGLFGIFAGNADTEAGAIQVWSLTHRPSGYRVSLFALSEAATIAADVAERIGDWTEIGADGLTNQAWKDRARRMFAMWQNAGLIYGPLTVKGRGVWFMAEPIAPVTQ